MGTIFFMIFFSKMFIMLVFNFFIMLNHPLMLSLLLILSTIMIILSIFNSSINMWFSFILCLIYLGGVLILFIYISSFLPNTSFFSFSWLFFSFIWMSILMFFYSQEVFDFFSYYNNSMMNFNMLFLNMKSNLMLFSIFYLIFILLITVYYSFFKKMPLRSID